MLREINKEIKRDYILTLLEKGDRVDGRKFDEYREIALEFGVVKTAEGSCLARIGTTQVIAGVKIDIVEPFASDPELGVLITNAEFLPLASSSFDPGPPSVESIEFARVIDRGIRHAEIIPIEDFYIEENKVLGVFIDLYVLDYGGNLIDTGALAAMGALLNTKIPKVEDGKLIRDEGKPLKLKGEEVVATTFYKIDRHLLVDATIDEEIASDARLTIGTSGEYVVSAQKGGSGTFKKAEIEEIIDMAFEKRKELVKYLKAYEH